MLIGMRQEGNLVPHGSVGSNFLESDTKQFTVSILKHGRAGEEFPGVTQSLVHKEA